MTSKKKLLKTNKLLVKGCKRLVRENAALHDSYSTVWSRLGDARARIDYLVDFLPKDADGCFTMPDGSCIAKGDCLHHTRDDIDDMELKELPGPFADPAVTATTAPGGRDYQSLHWCTEHNQQKLFCGNEPHQPTHIVHGTVTVVEEGAQIEGMLLDNSRAEEGAGVTIGGNRFDPGNRFVGVPETALQPKKRKRTVAERHDADQ